uniref:Uncharacterized protein n=1 Tax=Anopheles farauti TaxID=69004 RepID=A0A182QQD5_9DIPT
MSPFMESLSKFSALGGLALGPGTITLTPPPTKPSVVSSPTNALPSLALVTLQPAIDDGKPSGQLGSVLREEGDQIVQPRQEVLAHGQLQPLVYLGRGPLLGICLRAKREETIVQTLSANSNTGPMSAWVVRPPISESSSNGFRLWRRWKLVSCRCSRSIWKPPCGLMAGWSSAGGGGSGAYTLVPSTFTNAGDADDDDGWYGDESPSSESRSMLVSAPESYSVLIGCSSSPYGERRLLLLGLGTQRNFTVVRQHRKIEQLRLVQQMLSNARQLLHPTGGLLPIAISARRTTIGHTTSETFES